MTDVNKLSESLRTMRSSARRHHDGQGGKVRWSVVLDAQWIGDLSDAADLIERQAAEIQSLKEAAHGLSTLAGELAADLDRANGGACSMIALAHEQTAVVL